MLELFFAMFYASVNVGAVLCMWFVPMIRSKYIAGCKVILVLAILRRPVNGLGI